MEETNPGRKNTNKRDGRTSFELNLIFTLIASVKTDDDMLAILANPFTESR